MEAELMSMSLQELVEIWKDEGAKNKKLAEMERRSAEELDVGWDSGHDFFQWFFFCL